jgi:hypothetical protein
VIRLVRLAVRLYPAPWQRRYGAELEALVEQSGATWRTVLDIAKGALIMQLSNIARSLYAVIGCTLLGAAGGAILAGIAPARHSSVFNVEFESPSQSAEDRVRELTSTAFNDSNLDQLIAQFGLSWGDERRGPDAVRQFRGDIAVKVAAPNMVQVSLRQDPAGASRDGDTSARVSERLAALLVEANLHIAEGRAQQGGLSPGRVRLTGRPRHAADRPNASLAIVVGLSSSLAAGLAIALLRRHRAPAT